MTRLIVFKLIFTAITLSLLLFQIVTEREEKASIITASNPNTGLSGRLLALGIGTNGC